MGNVERLSDYLVDPDKANFSNIAEYIRSNPLFKDTFAYDEMQGGPVLTRPLPGDNLEPTVVPCRFTDPVEDSHVLRVLELIQLTRFPVAKKSDVSDAIDLVASENKINPLRDSLERLEWDGRPRLNTFASRYLGAENTELNNLFCRKWFIAAVARVLRPGCKVDHVLILEGAQGIGKSTVARTIAWLSRYFSDCLPDMKSKDARDHLRGKWIVEIPELSAMRRSEIEETKAFITATEDKFRPSYGRRDQTFQRRCVFIGTTNSDSYLKDSTGNRRFWPVKCGAIDIPSLARDRDQILAEAVAAFGAGEPWWLTDEADIALAAEAQAARVEVDDWCHQIAPRVAVMSTHDTMTTDDVRVALEILPAHWAQREKLRAGAVLKTLGLVPWKKGTVARTMLYRLPSAA